MTLRLYNGFIKSVPQSYRNAVINKIIEFTYLMKENSYDYRRLPRGFWIRRIQNTAYYKFRMNSGDRILFRYIDDSGRKIVFVRFARHDDQIREALRKAKPDMRMVELDTSYYPGNPHEDRKDRRLVTDDITLSKMIENNAVERLTPDQLSDWINQEVFLYQPDPEQRTILNKQGNVIISGGAGSGKTMLSVLKLMHFSNEKVAYFTYSDNLAGWAKKLYTLNATTINENILFKNIDAFWEELAADDNRRLVTFRDFSVWYMRQSGNKKLDPRVVWQEIHGVIKGRLGNDGERLRHIPGKLISRHCFQWLIDEHYADRTDDLHEYGKGILAVPGQNLMLKKERLEDLVKKLHRGVLPDGEEKSMLIRMARGEYLPQSAISRGAYYTLNSKNNLFAPEDRNRIYDLYLRYEKWLEKENRTDANDMARKLLNASRSLPPFDALVMDEIQDFSQLQIWALCGLSQKRENLFLAGDVHQIIQPTVYDPGLIQNIFSVFNYSGLKRYALKDNYRSSKRVTGFANAVVALRRDKIGSSKSDVIQNSLNDEQGNAFLLREQDKNMGEVFRALSRRSYVAVIFPDNEIRQKYARLIEQYNAAVFTPQEIKGLEFDAIIAYKLTGYWEKAFTRIMADRARDSMADRFYMNILYVGATRARKTLILWEGRKKTSVLDALEDNLRVIDNFDVNRLDLSKVSNENEQLETAENMERNESYEQAIQLYRRVSHLDKAREGITRCEIMLIFNRGLWQKGFARVRKTDTSIWPEESRILLRQYAKELKDKFSRVLWQMWDKAPKGNALYELLNQEGINLTDVLRERDILPEEKSKMLNNLIDPMLAAFRDKITTHNIYMDIIGETLR